MCKQGCYVNIFYYFCIHEQIRNTHIRTYRARPTVFPRPGFSVGVETAAFLDRPLPASCRRTRTAWIRRAQAHVHPGRGGRHSVQARRAVGKHGFCRPARPHVLHVPAESPPQRHKHYDYQVYKQDAPPPRPRRGRHNLRRGGGRGAPLRHRAGYRSACRKYGVSPRQALADFDLVEPGATDEDIRRLAYTSCQADEYGE